LDIVEIPPSFSNVPAYRNELNKFISK
jgi:hypothetical protein